jgi:hypothetical protein
MILRGCAQNSASRQQKLQMWILLPVRKLPFVGGWLLISTGTKAGRKRMRKEDLMNPDPLSSFVLLSSGLVLVAALVMVVVLALTHFGSALSTTPLAALTG